MICPVGRTHDAQHPTCKSCGGCSPVQYPLTLVFPFPPATGNHTTGHNRKTRKFYTVPKVIEYRKEIARYVAESARHATIIEKVLVRVELTPPDKRRRDSGNIIKVFYDSLTRAGLWADDSLVKDERIMWGEPQKPGKITITISPLG